MIKSKLNFDNLFIAFVLSTVLFVLIFVPIVGFKQAIAMSLLGMYVNIAKIAMSLILAMYNIKAPYMLKMFSIIVLAFFAFSFFEFSLPLVLVLSSIGFGVLCLMISKFVRK